jgi:uncharacterized RDD family membrane protein YckC
MSHDAACHTRASLLRRFAALVYDTFLLAAVWMAAGGLWVATRGDAVPAGDWGFRAYLLAVTFAFLGGFWVHAGRTLGMQAWRLRLIADNGGAVGWQAAGIRFAAAGLSWALLGGGFLWALIDREGRTLHDHCSGTRIVRLPRNAAR